MSARRRHPWRPRRSRRRAARADGSGAERQARAGRRDGRSVLDDRRQVLGGVGRQYRRRQSTGFQLHRPGRQSRGAAGKGRGQPRPHHRRVERLRRSLPGGPGADRRIPGRRLQRAADRFSGSGKRTADVSKRSRWPRAWEGGLMLGRQQLFLGLESCAAPKWMRGLPSAAPTKSLSGTVLRTPHAILRLMTSSSCVGWRAGRSTSSSPLSLLT
jgi:hypothetical protein